VLDLEEKEAKWRGWFGAAAWWTWCGSSRGSGAADEVSLSDDMVCADMTSSLSETSIQNQISNSYKVDYKETITPTNNTTELVVQWEGLSITMRSYVRLPFPRV
jgi:hypothetical protein